MIRRDVGNAYLLIAQDDHAKLAAELARHFGNQRFMWRPDPWREVVDAVAMHDAGWPLHDDAPTLNLAGLPIPMCLNRRGRLRSKSGTRRRIGRAGGLRSLHEFARESAQPVAVGHRFHAGGGES